MYFAGSNGGAFTPRRTLFVQSHHMASSNASKVTWKRFPQNIVAQRQKSSILPLVVLLNWKVKTTILNKNSNRQKPLLTSKKTLGNTSEATGLNRREDMMHAAESLAHNVHVKKACKALGIPRASYYYYQKCKKTLLVKGCL